MAGHQNKVCPKNPVPAFGFHQCVISIINVLLLRDTVYYLMFFPQHVQTVFPTIDELGE